MAREKRMVTLISSKTGAPLVRDKQQRNALCDCGSGKKCKKCCGETHKYYDTGKTRDKVLEKFDAATPEDDRPTPEPNTSE